jgi:[protein-PII] uridylyltransferase
LLQDQDYIAEVLGYADADVLMAEVSEAGRSIAWVTDEAWRRRERWQPSTRRGVFGRRAPAAPEARPVEAGVVMCDGEVALAPDAPVAADPALAFRLAAVAAEGDLPIATESLGRLRADAPEGPARWTPGMRAAFVRVLAAGRSAIAALESLEHHGLLTRYLPEWATVRNRPQRNAYHRFTVDRHLLETAANAGALTDQVERPDLLLVGALLHDIGKGSPGDHTEAGIELVEGIAGRMGFPSADVETLQAMVRHHLLLPDTATRRDLDDPATIEKVAAAAHDIATLDLLSALTEADSLATGPAAWGGWKASLVRELSARTASTLRGDVSRGVRWVTEDDLALVAQVRERGRLDVVLAPPRLAVAAPDRRGLLASVAGVLALHGLDVRSANVTSDEGVALEVFAVESAAERWPAQARLRQDLEAVLEGTLVVAERLAEKERAYAGTRRPSSPYQRATRVTLDDDASHSATVIEVFTTDRIGLLHRVTKALFDCGLDVISARVATLGAEVVDAFYVSPAGGGKVDSVESRQRIERAVREATA